MKRWRVRLKDGQMTFIAAIEYTRDEDRYVFRGEDGVEIAFFMVSEIVGVEQVE